ncbi:hypothetical protein [Gimesia panareensis]|uniref:hypothetical protein n=1 Tax=Gimesia panareensis TaxID=2527978 RepID=UPI00118B7484|nr:hypothetical protein [Gimesia panareensis]QDU53146.1 hypothetical protein Pan110_55310 [Gimesia panareensis]
MNRELADLVQNAPEEAGDEAYVFKYPELICMQWGDSAFQYLLELFIASGEDDERLKIETLLTNLSEYSDGPPSNFVQKTANLLNQLQRDPAVLTVCLNSCARCMPVWRETSLHRDIKQLCEQALKTLDFQTENNRARKFWKGKTHQGTGYCRFLKQGLQHWLERNERRREALHTAAKGKLVIPDSVVEQAFQEDESRGHPLGLNRVSHASLVKMLIYSRCWPNYYEGEDHPDTRTFELASTPLPEIPSTVRPFRKTVKTLWESEQGTRICRGFQFLC